MKKYLLISGAALTAIALFGPAAIAGPPGPALDVTLGPGITGLLNTTQGTFANIGVNNAVIDASVTETAGTPQAGTAPITPLLHTISIVSTGYNGFGAGTYASFESIESPASGGTGAVAIIGGTIATTAVGAVNDGQIELNSDSLSVGLSGSYTHDTSSATADATHAFADADYINVQLEDAHFDTTTLPDTAAMNIAFNNNDINASVNLTGIAAATDTTAVGAVNTGVIKVGIGD